MESKDSCYLRAYGGRLIELKLICKKFDHGTWSYHGRTRNNRNCQNNV